MGILGTNTSEEDNLRNAAASASEDALDRRQSYVSATTGSSAYETAEEDVNSIGTEQYQPDVHSKRNSDVVPAVADPVAADHDDNDTDADTIRGVAVGAGAGSTAAAGGAAAAGHSHSAAGSAAPHRDTPSDLLTSEDHSVADYYEPEPNVEPYEGTPTGGAAGAAGNHGGNSDENALNRRYTIERIASRRTIEEDADGTLTRELTKKSAPGKVQIADLNWDSPDDPGNPQNWPAWRKWYITFAVASICLTVSLGSSLYVSGVPEIAESFKVSEELAVSGLTFYLLGLALGPVFAAPLSELAGRRWIYLISLPVSMLFAMGVGLAKNIETILVLRFICGFIASPAMAVAGGSISDIWSPDKMGFAMAMFCLAPFLGPVLGPVVGNFAAQNKGWKWTMWVSLMFSGASLPFVLALPETYKPAILAKRAKKRGIELALPEWNAATIKTLLFVVLLRPLEMLFVEPIVAIFSIYIAFIFAVLFGFFEAFPIIFDSVYDMNQGVSGLPFIAVGVGLMLGVVFYIYMDKKYYFPKNPDGTRGRRDENGQIIWDAPESRLFLGKVGAIALPIALFWLGWTSRKSVHWIVPTISGAFFGFGLILIFFTVILYFSMSFPPSSVASALAANNFLRYLLAAVFPLFMVQMYTRLHIDWATSLLGFVSLAMLPVPFVFGKYGPKLRASSKYGYASYFKKLAAQKAAAEAEKNGGAAPAAAAADDDANTDKATTATAPESAESVEKDEKDTAYKV